MAQGLRSPLPFHSSGRRAPASTPLYFVATLLAVEFLDEIVDGLYRAAWPLIRTDLDLSYVEIGVLLSVPGIVGAALEISFGVLGDVWNRRALVLGGGVCFALALVVTGFSRSFAALLVAWIIMFPASGAFVNLSQAALMDARPERREQNMARWTLTGSVANVTGPLALSAAVVVGAGWRAPFFVTAALMVVAVVFLRRLRFPLPQHEEGAEGARGFRAGLRGVFGALRRWKVLRWLLLLEVGDFTMNALRDFLALYFVDVVGASETTAALAVLVWTAAGLPGDALLLPLLERVRGLSYLRISAAACLVLFVLFMLAEALALKLALVGLLGFANAGWYSILQARLYAELPNRSGAVMALGNIVGLVNYLTPLALGAFAESFGLEAMMWLLLIGPAALLCGLARNGKGPRSD